MGGNEQGLGVTGNRVGGFAGMVSGKLCCHGGMNGFSIFICWLSRAILETVGWVPRLKI